VDQRARAVDDATQPRREHVQDGADAGEQKHRRDGELNRVGDVRFGDASHAAPRIMSAMRATVFLMLVTATGASATEYVADAGSFTTLLNGLQAGDTLDLLPGTYPHFSLSGKNGTSGAWITIEGPPGGPAAVVQADLGPCCNTIEISDSSYIAL